MKINWAISSNSIILNFDGKTKNIAKEDSLYQKVYSAIKEKRTDEIPSILNIEDNINKSSSKAIEISDGVAYVDGDAVQTHISDRIVQYYNEGIPYDGLVAFWRNLKLNPSARARDRLFAFLDNGGHPFTDDGCFIAYKGVTADFKDCYTQKFDNSIGAKPTMNRADVNDDPEITCAAGLHVASYSYVSSCYSSTQHIIVKVNPKDVVSIPVDYNNQKMRTCGYEVMAVADGLLKDTHYSSPDVEKDSSSSEEVVESSSSSSSESSSSDSSSSSSEEEPVQDKPPVVEFIEDLPPDFVQSDLDDTDVIETDIDDSSEESSSEEE